MSLISIFILAAGLSVDSMAASISTGVCMKKVRAYESVKVALYMAVFQGSLPIVGWYIGQGFKHIISSYDHWIAFILLLAIGTKMIFEGLKKEEQNNCFCPSRPIILAGMALATSIDALIVGVGIGLLGNTIWLPAIIIGIITFIFSISGIYLGHHLGHRLNIKLELIGGLVLIGLGIKILVEHTLLA
ncbi:MAG TPA: manganese efflux pump MntP family protein [Salinivirga sp.]|uniref:manganese efflux pump MntP n=1 Tax=Salinivirga sp. TaxID=1970192 RepID=UPI002B48EF82|nr:manganese efflux pump MntP family protein [Salinivirga sp.]HKK60805.1 manganese efflux pump MntP family protein [Salinivirga sp.]